MKTINDELVALIHEATQPQGRYSSFKDAHDFYKKTETARIKVRELMGFGGCNISPTDTCDMNGDKFCKSQT